MTSCAILRSGLIEQNRLRFDDSSQFVTFGTAHVLMGSAQRKLRPLFVIEQRRLPLHAVVAFSAARNSCVRELLAMNILMAVFALRRSRFEIDIDELGLEIRRLVAVDASGRSVRTKQRKFGFRMVETGKFFP